MLIGSDTDQALYFGSQQVRKYDLCTAIAISLQIGATNLKCVRVTDGTDLAAAIALKDTATPTAATGMTLTAKYSGTKGNGITAKISTGTAVNSYKLTVYFPGQTPEVFDNITGSGAALWASLVSAAEQRHYRRARRKSVCRGDCWYINCGS
ncbi:hypothetical protein [Pantoea stewartii]|uniref:hypothetical protein n=1 Tax=Pantoea stewartii TaxID=66269 RepID=UPI0037041235